MRRHWWKLNPVLATALAVAGCHLWSAKQTERVPQKSDNASQNPAQPLNSSQGGVIDGNGGEFIGNEHNPWFVGRGPVPYCISISENFSLGLKAASLEIASAFSAWKAFMTKIYFNGVSRDFKGRATEEPNRKLIREFVEVDCTKTPPLQFKLGVFDDAINGAMKYSAQKLVGLAIRSDYDEEAGFAKGVIWVTPDRGPKMYLGPKIEDHFWSRPQLFRNVIVHELGHVFGLQHLPQTIMDARFPAQAVETGFDEEWNGDEFLIDRPGEAGICGDIVYGEPKVLSEFLQLASPEGASICFRRNNALRGSDENTPLTLTVKSPVGDLKEYRIAIQDGDTTESWLVGLFPEANSDGSTSYKRTWFGSLSTSMAYRGQFPHGTGTEQQAVQVIMLMPGLFKLVLPYKGQWQDIGFVLHERRDFVLKLSKILSED